RHCWVRPPSACAGESSARTRVLKSVDLPTLFGPATATRSSGASLASRGKRSRWIRVRMRRASARVVASAASGSRSVAAATSRSDVSSPGMSGSAATAALVLASQRVSMAPRSGLVLFPESSGMGDRVTAALLGSDVSLWPSSRLAEATYVLVDLTQPGGEETLRSLTQGGSQQSIL